MNPAEYPDALKMASDAFKERDLPQLAALLQEVASYLQHQEDVRDPTGWLRLVAQKRGFRVGGWLEIDLRGRYDLNRDFLQWPCPVCADRACPDLNDFPKLIPVRVVGSAVVLQRAEYQHYGAYFGPGYLGQCDQCRTILWWSSSHHG